MGLDRLWSANGLCVSNTARWVSLLNSYLSASQSQASECLENCAADPWADGSAAARYLPHRTTISHWYCGIRAYGCDHLTSVLRHPWGGLRCAKYRGAAVRSPRAVIRVYYGKIIVIYSILQMPYGRHDASRFPCGHMTEFVSNVKLAPDSPASYSRIWGWRIWCQLHVGELPHMIRKIAMRSAWHLWTYNTTNCRRTVRLQRSPHKRPVMRKNVPFDDVIMMQTGRSWSLPGISVSPNFQKLKPFLIWKRTY